MSRDIIDLAISMTEIDTGLELSLEEREAMARRILKKLLTQFNIKTFITFFTVRHRAMFSMISGRN